MADSTEGDGMVLYLGLSLALIALIAGLVIHSFIIVINVIDWFKGRSVTPIDHIITCLGISRMCVQWAVTLCFLMSTLFIEYPYAYKTWLIMAATYYFCSYANVWLTSLLSIVFCLKISTLRTRLFLYLRRMIDRRIAHCIVGSVLLSTINSFLAFLPAITGANEGEATNTTTKKTFNDCTFLISLYSHSVSASIPLLFFCLASILFFSFLYHHVTKMKMSGNFSINLETYYSAMRFVAITFIYNVIFFIGHFACVLYYYLNCMSLVWPHVVLGFLPSLHSSYLIYRTAKLRSHMSKVLHNVTDFLFQRKDPKSREDIEVEAL